MSQNVFEECNCSRSFMNACAYIQLIDISPQKRGSAHDGADKSGFKVVLPSLPSKVQVFLYALCFETSTRRTQASKCLTRMVRKSLLRPSRFWKHEKHSWIALAGVMGQFCWNVSTFWLQMRTVESTADTQRRNIFQEARNSFRNVYST